MTMPIGQCRLCQTTAPLRHSHIIPEFCYGAVYDEKHRGVKLHARTFRRETIQKGLREHLLCERCEGHLNDNFEKPFKAYWYDRAGLPSTIPPGQSVIRITGFDYASFKLFHLSVLWRAGVASSADFRSVDLGTYEPKLRQMIRDCDPGPVDHYPIFAMAMIDEARAVCHSMVMRPHHAKYEHHHAYFLGYAGCEWYTILTDHPDAALEGLMPLVPSLEGTMLLGTDHWSASKSWNEFISQRKQYLTRA